MKRGKVAKAIALCLGSAVLLTVAAVVYLPRTAWGREKIRGAIEDALNGTFAGRVSIGRIDGLIFSGATIHDIVITDSAGAPFINAPLVRARWALGDLWARRVILSDVRAERPVIVLDKLPGQRWNWDKILFPDTASKPRTSDARQFGDWVELKNVHLVDATLTARSPYEVPSGLSATARDSIIALALAGELRPVVRAVPGGYQRVTVLERTTMTAPYVRIKLPGETSQLFRIASGSAIVKPFHPPALDLRNIQGTMQVDTDSLWFRNLAATLPASNATVSGMYNITSGDTRIEATAPTVATSDWRWLVPLLPEGGTGAIDVVRYVSVGTSSTVRLQDLSLALEEARLRGLADFSFVGDEMKLNDVNIAMSGLDTRLLHRLMPDVTLPRSGVLEGTLTARGLLTAATIDANLRFADREAGLLAARANGIVGTDAGAVVMRNLRVDLSPVPVTLASLALQPLGGRIGGRLLVDGRTDGWIDTRMNLVHVVNGLDSHIDGTTRVNIAGSEPLVDARLRFSPLSLPAMARFAPGLDLRGDATGTLTLRGALSDMGVNAALRVDSAGGVLVAGRFGVPERGPSHANVVLTIDSLDLQRLTPTSLKTKLVGYATIDARGSSVETLDGRVVVDLRASEIDRLTVDTVALVAEARDGLVTLDTLMLRIGGAIGAGSGTFGLRQDRPGRLVARIHLDSLQRLRPYLPGDTALVAQTQAAIARSLRRQRSDSLALARRTQVERLARGLPPLALRVTAPQPVRADSLAGEVTIALTLQGWLRDISGTGSLEARNLFASGTSAASVSLRPSFSHILTDSSEAHFAGNANGIIASGFNVDSLDMEAGYRWRRATLATGTGNLAINLHLLDSTAVTIVGALQLDATRYAARVDSTVLQLPSSRWANLYPWRASWADGKFVVDSLALVTSGDARLQLDAAIDTAGLTNVTLAIRNTQLWDLADLAQAVSPVDGRVSADLYVDGPATAPKISFLAAVRDVVYDSLPLPEFRARMTYDSSRAEAYAEVRRPGQQPNARATATIPINLALTGSPKRLLNLPMIGEIRLDSLPLDIVPALSAAVTDLRGETRGLVTVRGTLPDKLTFDGTMTLRNGEMTLAAVELPLRDIAGDLRFRGDSVVIDSVLVHSGDGTVRVSGGVGLRVLTNPLFDMKMVARNARILDGKQGRLSALADLTLTGPYDGATLEGSLRVRDGVYRIAEPTRTVAALDANDPAVLGAIDSTEAANSGLVVAPSSFVRGLKTSVVARIDRDVWVRNQEANVEIFTDGELAVAVNPVTGGVTLDGIIATERGQYEFLNKRFNIVRGSATFIGTSDLNPLLQAVAEIPVRPAGQQALAIRLNIAGTLLEPSLSLDSDAQPPIPQTDLISYVAFGNSSGGIISQSGSGLAGGGTGGGGIAGAAGAFFGRQISTLALGELLNSVKGSATRFLSADVLNITPTGNAPELGNFASGVSGYLLATRIEFGRYFGTQSYVELSLSPSLRSSSDNPTFYGTGLRWEYRMPRNMRLETSYGPRFLLESQTLAPTRPRGIDNIGVFLSREWKW